MEALGPLLLVIGGMVVAALIVWAIMHHRYVKSFEDKGWAYEGSPPISIAHGLNVAPFGVGLERGVKKQISGPASDGTAFSAFMYRSSAWDPGDLVVTMKLPHSMPLAEVPAGGPVRTADPSYAAELARALGGATRDLTVDHDTLVMLRVSDDADELQTAVDALAAARAALLASAAAGRQGPTPPQGLSFAEHPDWTYVPRDDELLRQVEHSGGGYGHEARDIIMSENGRIPFIRMQHNWKTDSTRTDSEGRSHTTTTHHTEYLCQFRTSFPFVDLASNWGWFGRSQRFEWTDFNDAVRIESSNERIAHAVIHQRQMEYLMASGAPKFAIQGDGSILLKGFGKKWLIEDILGADAFLRGFFARVPDIVWQELGAWPRPIPEIEPAPQQSAAPAPQPSSDPIN